jgi:hypothetical protein
VPLPRNIFCEAENSSWLVRYAIDLNFNNKLTVENKMYTVPLEGLAAHEESILIEE